MKITFRRLSLAACLLAVGATAQADDVMSVGDLAPPATQHVGDVMSVGDAVPAPLRSNSKSVKPLPASTKLPAKVQAKPASSIKALAKEPVSFEKLQLAGYASSDCDTLACDDACDSGCQLGAKLNKCDTVWASAELLLWFPQARNVVDLVATADTTIFPDPNLTTTSIIFGGDGGLDGGLSAGFRADYGKYLSDSFGVGGRFWILGENEDSYSFNGDGTGASIGRPYYNTNIDALDSLIVNQDGLFAGTLDIESQLEIWAVEAYARIKLAADSCCRTELIGGYSHFQIDDSLTMNSRTITLASARTRIFNDSFDAENEFNGGQLGLSSVMARGGWTLSTLAKVHLGNVRQQMEIRG
ncbi:MAG: BBP7 family outer membrane beta-barrel protein, partial [Planctomycetota bacterium]